MHLQAPLAEYLRNIWKLRPMWKHLLTHFPPMLGYRKLLFVLVCLFFNFKNSCGTLNIFFFFESLKLLRLSLSWKPHLEWQEEKVYHDQETPLWEKHLITVTSTPTSLLPKCPLWPCSSNIRGCSNRKVRSTYSSVRSKGNTPLLHYISFLTVGKKHQFGFKDQTQPALKNNNCLKHICGYALWNARVDWSLWVSDQYLLIFLDSAYLLSPLCYIPGTPNTVNSSLASLYLLVFASDRALISVH